MASRDQGKGTASGNPRGRHSSAATTRVAPDTAWQLSYRDSADGRNSAPLAVVAAILAAGVLRLRACGVCDVDSLPAPKTNVLAQAPAKSIVMRGGEVG